MRTQKDYTFVNVNTYDEYSSHTTIIVTKGNLVSVSASNTAKAFLLSLLIPLIFFNLFSNPGSSLRQINSGILVPYVVSPTSSPKGFIFSAPDTLWHLAIEKTESCARNAVTHLFFSVARPSCFYSQKMERNNNKTTIEIRKSLQSCGRIRRLTPLRLR